MILRKTIALLCAAAMLAACGDNDKNAQETESVRLVPLAEIFEGYEALQVKEYGQFVLPGEIEKSEIDAAFELGCISPKNSIPDSTVKEIYRVFYNDSYSEENLSTDEHGGILYKAGENLSAYWGMDISLYSEEQTAPEAFSAQYDAFHNRNDTVSFCGKSYTVKDLADKISSELDSVIAPAYQGYTVRTESVGIGADGDVDFSCSLSKDGIPFQYVSSAYLKNDVNGEMVYWSFSSLGGIYGEKGFKVINAPALNVISESRELKELVPLAGAVEILERELAEYIDLEFSDVRLMYCCLTAQPVIDRTDAGNEQEAERLTEEYNRKTKKYVPMWCFEIKSDREDTAKSYVKVNAVTGELYMDIK